MSGSIEYKPRCDSEPSRETLLQLSLQRMLQTNNKVSTKCCSYKAIFGLYETGFCFGCHNQLILLVESDELVYAVFIKLCLGGI